MFYYINHCFNYINHCFNYIKTDVDRCVTIVVILLNYNIGSFNSFSPYDKRKKKKKAQHSCRSNPKPKKLK